jgi:hypothetical protein
MNLATNQRAQKRDRTNVSISHFGSPPSVAVGSKSARTAHQSRAPIKLRLTEIAASGKTSSPRADDQHFVEQDARHLYGQFTFAQARLKVSSSGQRAHALDDDIRG